MISDDIGRAEKSPDAARELLGATLNLSATLRYFVL